MTQKTKFCTKCKKELPATTDYFYYSKKSKDGLRYHCKDCWRDYKREHRQQIAKNRKEYKKNNWEGWMKNHLKHIKIKRLKPKQKYCSICNQEKKLDLSSVDGKYSENPNDYWWLCHECHALYDRINKTHKKKVNA